MTKVAYLLGALERGGTEVLILDTLKRAKEFELDCILVYRKSGSLTPAFEETGVPLYQRSPAHSLDLGYFGRLRSLLLSEGVRIVHAQLPFDGFLAYWSSLGTGIKILLTFHGYDVGYSRLGRFMIRFISRHTDLNFFVSRNLRNHYISTFSLENLLSRQEVVYNGIDFGKLVEATGLAIRNELNIPGNALLLGSVGNFVQGRDQMTVCSLLAELQKRGVDFHFVFAGARSKTTPWLYDDCVSFCQHDDDLRERVHFVGSRDDVPAILSVLDAFVYASDHDTFGIAVVEAIAAGLPVFVNDWEVMKEITDKGQRVILYKTKDVADLTDKVINFIKNKTDFQQQALENKIWVQNTYSIEKHVRTLQQHYLRILKPNV